MDWFPRLALDTTLKSKTSNEEIYVAFGYLLYKDVSVYFSKCPKILRSRGTNSYNVKYPKIREVDNNSKYDTTG